MARKKNTPKLPPVDGKPDNYYYLTCNTRKDDGAIMSKDEMKRRFLDRFGMDPETVFYGPPNGSLIYAGPVTRTKPASPSRDLQLSLELE